jgi:hypothetical protein
MEEEEEEVTLKGTDLFYSAPVIFCIQLMNNT